MIEYISYAKALEFEQKPDYKYLKILFSRILKRMHNSNDQLVFSWIKFSDVSNLKNPINFSTRKDTPLNRIYKKITSSLEREKKHNSHRKDVSYKRINIQKNGTNLKVINKEKYSKSEGKTEKNMNKRLLKFIEGLNTNIANLDGIFDENVDFEKEIVKRISRESEVLSDFNDIIENKFNSNENNNNFFGNQNVIINCYQNNRYIEIYENNEVTNEVNKNLNLEFNKNAKIKEKNENNLINNLDININNSINFNIDNDAFINNNNFLNEYNKNESIKNIYTIIDNINRENNNAKESTKMKISNFNGIEFKFNETFDFKSNLNVNKKKRIKNENSNNINQEKKN